MADNPGQELLDLLRVMPQTDSNVNALPEMKPPRPGIERYAREGVPLDVTSGVPFGKRAGLSFADTDQQRIEFLRKAYAGSQVDQTDEGELIVRNVLDVATGQPKDMLVDEQDVTVKDLADMTAAGLKGVTEFFLLKGLGIANSPNVLTRVVGGSVAGAAASEGIGATSQALLQMEQTFGEHLKQAGKNAAFGAALGGAAEGTIGAVNARRGLLKHELAPGPDEAAGIAGLRAIQRDTGIEITPTLGQIAKDPSVMRLESYLSRLPLFNKLFQSQTEAQEASIRQLQRKLMGEQPLQPLADMGADIVETLRTTVRQPHEAAELAEQALVTRAADQLESAIQRLSPSARSFTEEGTAALTKFAAGTQMAKFKQVADTLFSEVGNPEISTAPLKPLLQDVKASLPKRTVISESDLTDAAGKPLATSEGKEIVRELVPTELQRFLNGLESLDATMPLDELRRIRNTVDDAIREGRGLEGVSTYELKKLQHAITETINRGAEGLEGGAGAALLRANAFYRENIERFEVPLVTRLLKDTPDAPGFIRNFELVQSIRSNPDNYRDVERFLKSSVTENGQAISGNSEKVLGVLKRSIVEDIYSRAKVSPGGGNLVNADAFANELAAMRPEIRAAILGGEEEVISKNIELLKQLKSGYKEVPIDKLEAFMRFPANSVQDLSKLATARKAEAELFGNEVIAKLFKGGNIDANELRSEKALDWLLKAGNNTDVSQVMSLLGDNPEVVESIRRNTVARLFQEVAQKTKPADAARLADNSQLVSPAKMIDALRDPQSRERLRTLLGADTFNIVENFAQSQAVLGKSSGATLMGTNTATSMMTRMLQFFKDVPHAAKLLIYSTVLTNRNLQRAMMDASLTKGGDAGAFTAAVISSVPVIDALAQEYSMTGAELVLQSVGKALSSVRNEDGLKMRGERTNTAPDETVSTDPGAELLQLLSQPLQR